MRTIKEIEEEYDKTIKEIDELRRQIDTKREYLKDLICNMKEHFI